MKKIVQLCSNNTMLNDKKGLVLLKLILGLNSPLLALINVVKR